LAIIAAHQASMKHVKQRMSMRSGNARYSAEVGVSVGSWAMA
jgi:hypothetical protein